MDSLYQIDRNGIGILYIEIGKLVKRSLMPTRECPYELLDDFDSIVYDEYGVKGYYLTSSNVFCEVYRDNSDSLTLNYKTKKGFLISSYVMKRNMRVQEESNISERRLFSAISGNKKNIYELEIKNDENFTYKAFNRGVDSGIEITETQKIDENIEILTLYKGFFLSDGNRINLNRGKIIQYIIDKGKKVQSTTMDYHGIVTLLELEHKFNTGKKLYIKNKNRTLYMLKNKKNAVIAKVEVDSDKSYFREKYALLNEHTIENEMDSIIQPDKYSDNLYCRGYEIHGEKDSKGEYYLYEPRHIPYEGKKRDFSLNKIIRDYLKRY